jgi:hypothetical protein
MEIIDSTGFELVNVFGEAAVDAEPGDGEHLLQSFPQRGSGTGAVVLREPGQAPGVAQPPVPGRGGRTP